MQNKIDINVIMNNFICALGSSYANRKLFHKFTQFHVLHKKSTHPRVNGTEILLKAQRILHFHVKGKFMEIFVIQLKVKNR